MFSWAGPCSVNLFFLLVIVQNVYFLWLHLQTQNSQIIHFNSKISCFISSVKFQLSLTNICSFMLKFLCISLKQFLFIVSAAAAAAKLLQSCLTLCDPMDCSLPGRSVHRISQARVLEWGAIASSSKAFSVQFSSFQFSRSVVSDSLRPHELQPGLPVHHQLPEFTQTHIH